MGLRSPFFDRLRARIDELGGICNAHLHLDRAYTLDPEHLDGRDGGITRNSHISLREKHGLIHALHKSTAYSEAGLTSRLSAVTDALCECGTTTAQTVVDVTDDRIGLSALDTMLDHAVSVRERITLEAASYNPFGFRDDAPRRWTLFEEGARRADFIGSLPERDDRREYPEHIGFEEHCVRVLDLARRLDKPLQIHTDQRNDPAENDTERFLAILRRDGAGPMVWAVHVISPSTYDERRFAGLISAFLETGAGVICCPSAALGMRQFRPTLTPTYNSIARVLDFAAAGVPVRLGSDNIADMCSPSTTADLVDEVFVLSAALRYYDVNVLSRLAAGQPLTADERASVQEHLDRNAAEIEKGIRAVSPVS